MSIFWDEDSPKTGLLLYISITLVVVLLWYIYRQDYSTVCDRRINDLHYQTHISKGDGPVVSKFQNTKVTMLGNSGTVLEKHKKIIEDSLL